MKKFIFILIASCSIYSQNNNLVTGQVVDESNQPLPGATITLNDDYTITDFNGFFEIQSILNENNKLTVKYLGYTDKVVDFTIGSLDLGQIIMTASSTELAEVIVDGTYLPSQVRALNIQKNSANIVNVLASDAIGKLPDRNAAEAVQRIQGVSIERDHGEGRYVIVRGTPISWNANLINGTRLPSVGGTSNDTGGDRAIPLDIFPAEMIEYVQLSKAITPDMEADAVGGSVNFLTKTAPQKRTLKLSVSGGYNGQAEGDIQNYSLLYGERLGKFGFVATGTYYDRSWATDNYEMSYNADLTGIKQYSLEELQLRDYVGRRKTTGFNFGSEYIFDNSNKIELRGLYTNFQDSERAREHLYDFVGGDMSLRSRHGIQQYTLQGGELSGSHLENSRFSFDWKVSYYDNEQNNGVLPDGGKTYYLAQWQQSMDFDGLASDGYKYLSGDGPANYMGDNYENVQPRTSSSFNPGRAFLRYLYAFNQASYEKDYNAQVDFKFDLNKKVDFKFGAKYKNKYKQGGAPYTLYLPTWALGMGGSFRMMDSYNTDEFPKKGGFLTELGENYDGILQNFITMGELYDLFTPDGIQNAGVFPLVYDETNRSTASSFYNGNETVTSFYIMGEFQLDDNVSSILGLRNEKTDLEYNGNSVNGRVISPVSTDGSSNIWLPNVHLKIELDEKTNLRAAVTKTIARPNFASLNPGQTVDEVNFFIARGNADLRATTSVNYDLMAEYYFDNIGILSAGLFYKSISNDIYSSTNIERIDGQYYTVIQPKNLEDSWFAGAEIGISKRFGISGFGVDANYTYTDSEVNVPTFSATADGIEKTITKQKSPEQSDHIFNLAFFYEKNNLLLRLASNYKGDAIVSFSDYGPNHNRIYGENFTMDFSGAYKISDKIRLFAEINNLTNSPLVYYHGVRNRPEQVEYYSIRGVLGLRFSIF